MVGEPPTWKLTVIPSLPYPCVFVETWNGLNSNFDTDTVSRTFPKPHQNPSTLHFRKQIRDELIDDAIKDVRHNVFFLHE